MVSDSNPRNLAAQEEFTIGGLRVTPLGLALGRPPRIRLAEPILFGGIWLSFSCETELPIAPITCSAI